MKLLILIVFTILSLKSYSQDYTTITPIDNTATSISINSMYDNNNNQK